MGFRDEIKIQSNEVVDQYAKLSFPGKGDVEKRVVTEAIESTIGVLEATFKRQVFEGRKYVKTRWYGYCYAVEMRLRIRMGYNESREKIPFEIKVNHESINIECSNYSEISTFLYNLESRLKNEFSKVKYVDGWGQEKRVYWNAKGVAKYIKNKLKFSWKNTEREWKKDTKTEFSVYEYLHAIVIELRCDKSGRII